MLARHLGLVLRGSSGRLECSVGALWGRTVATGALDTLVGWRGAFRAGALAADTEVTLQPLWAGSAGVGLAYVGLRHVGSVVDAHACSSSGSRLIPAPRLPTVVIRRPTAGPARSQRSRAASPRWPGRSACEHESRRPGGCPGRVPYRASEPESSRVPRACCSDGCPARVTRLGLSGSLVSPTRPAGAANGWSRTPCSRRGSTGLGHPGFRVIELVEITSWSRRGSTTRGSTTRGSTTPCRTRLRDPGHCEGGPRAHPSPR